MSTAQLIANAQKEVLVTADQRSGWSLVAEGQTTPARAVSLDIELQFDGSGYLLCYSSNDRLLYGDTWHLSESEAKQAALEDFGVQPDEWHHA